MTEEKKQIKTSTGILIILAAAVIIGGGAIACFYAMSPTSWDYMGNRTAVHKTSNANTNISNTNSATAGLKTYINSPTGLSFQYPSSWTIEEDVQDPTDQGVTLNSPTKNNLNQYIVLNLNYPASKVTAKDNVISVSTMQIQGIDKSYYLVTAGACCGSKGDDSNPDSYSVPLIYLTELKPDVGNLIPNLELYFTNPKDNTKTVQLASHLESTAASGNTTTLSQYQSHPDYQALLQIFKTLKYTK